MKKSTLIASLCLLLVSCTSPATSTPTALAPSETSLPSATISPSLTATEIPPTATPPATTTYLTDLEPISVYSDREFVVNQFPYSDADLGFTAGDPLAWHEHEFPHGMLVGPDTTLTYELNGQYFHFQAEVTKIYSIPCGDGVDFRVLGDLRELARVNLKASSALVKTIEVDVTGVRLLTLITDPINSYDCDEAIWGEPLLYGYKNTADIPTLQPISAPLPVAEEPLPEKMVFADYYGWYQPLSPWMWWENNDRWIDYPVGRYNSMDPDVIRTQVQQAKSAGIDGFAVEWLGMNSCGDDRQLQVLLDIAGEEDFKVFVLFDLLFKSPPTSPDVWVNIAYVLRNYGSHPAYLRVEGKPVVMFAYYYRLGSLETWQDTFDEVSRLGLSGFYIGDHYEIENLAVFDGSWDYNPFVVLDIPRFYPEFNLLFNEYVVSHPEEYKLWAATAMPGFDNTPIVHDGLGKFEFIDRQEGDFYRMTLQVAMDSGAPWIFITTWNEYLENTFIEPSERYGTMYLDITRELILPWKGK